MKRIIMLSSLLCFVMVLSAFSQVKIGEMNEGKIILSHDEQDLIQALEKEYDINLGTKFKYASIHASKDKNYWLVAGNGNPATQFKIAVPLRYNSTQNAFYVDTAENAAFQQCNDCTSPDCGLLIDKNGKFAGCADCNSNKSDEYCNHKISLINTSKPAVIRYLKK